MSKYIMVVGNPFDGLRLIGPFKDADDYYEFSESIDDEWNVVEVMSIEEYNKERGEIQ